MYVDPRECGLLMRWAINFYGSNSKAIEIAEDVAAWILASEESEGCDETTAEHVPYYARFIKAERTEPHYGDCHVAPSWRVMPMTCSACVYEEYVAKALEWLRVENSPIATPPGDPNA